jgi:hypothetical protein
MASSNVIPQQTTVMVSSIQVRCQNINLFTDATFLVDLYDADGVRVDRRVVPITNEEYLEWNSDDKFILNLVASKLGLTIEP